VSAQPGDGKSVVAANSALAAARSGSRVLALDADFGNLKLTALLTKGDSPTPWAYQTAIGLTDLAESPSAQLSDIVHSVRLIDGAEIDLITKGSGDVTPSDLVASSRAGELFEEIRETYDLVIIDTPPLIHVAYASELVRHADAALVVVRHGANVAPVEQVAERLAVLDVAAAGYVYNQMPLTDDLGRYEGSTRRGRAPVS